MNLNPPIVETKVIDKFLSDSDVELILTEAAAYNKDFDVTWHYEQGELECIITPISDTPTSKKSEQLLSEKLHKELGDDLIIGTMHILDSRAPYRAHTDGIFGEYGIDNEHYGSWTVVIPLETINTHTIIFNEWYVPSKNINEWIDTIEPIDSITDEIYEKYLSYEARNTMRYLSIETIFPWTKGSMLAASRYKWHASDNYLKNGVSSKKAIIAWCALPY